MDIRRHLGKLLWVIWFNNLSSVTPCGYQRTWPFPSQQLGINSSENLVLNQTISLLDFLVIFITRLPGSVLILQEEIISSSFLRVKGLSKDMFESRTATRRRMELRHQQISWNLIYKYSWSYPSLSRFLPKVIWRQVNKVLRNLS